VVKYFNSQTPLPTNNPDGDVNTESDYDGDSHRVQGESTKIGEEWEERTHAVFTTGSFSAYVYLPIPSFLEGVDVSNSWKSLFFYCCTDTISFAPLKSQGIDARVNYIREKTVAGGPPPCSPKSIYVLANLVR
jgi:hypothetical protein